MQTWIPIVTAFGLGSIVTALVSAWLNSKQQLLTRQFEEKKEAYIGLLEAYHRAAVEPSDANSKHFAFWQLRCELVASAQVISAVEQIIETNDDLDARLAAHSRLKRAMRKDLGLAK